jgi:hypothetical protein
MPMKRLYLIIVVLSVFISFSSAMAAPSARLWERWDAHSQSSTKTIDHSDWGQILSRNVHRDPDGINRFAYSSISDRDRNDLKDYLKNLSTVSISQYNRKQQLAYWINLYNAITVDKVISEYPVESIRDISSGFFSSGPWSLKLVKVENEELTLDDIEHRILRPIWKDARIHYAVNCASIGCPNLQKTAFTAENTEALMEQGARDYINHPRGVRVTNGELEVSSIYIWFQDDFGGNDAGVIEHIRQYASNPLKQALKGITSIDDDFYNWKINSLRETDP